MIDPNVPHKKIKSSKMNKAVNSEERRLKSLKEKKEAFKTKEKLIQEALQNVDAKPRNKKIKFDDNITEETLTEIEKKHIPLFDNDNSADDEDYSETFANKGTLKTSKEISEKRLKLQLRYGNDQRFILDERFDDNENDETQLQEVEEEAMATQDAGLDLVKEKNWQLNILGDVLGTPLAAKNDKVTTITKKNKMIRYDPLEKDHREYEIAVDQTEVKPKKKAKKVAIDEAVQNDSTPIPMSKEIYYSVSHNLTNSLKETGKFSLLNTLGRDKPEPRLEDTKVQNEPPKTNKKFHPHVDASNTFKYDSSDDDAEEQDNKIQMDNILEKGDYGVNQIFKKCDTFFFSSNDVRFNDALKFFDPNTVANKDLKNLRYELKQIIRAKIRNNVKKTQPWGRKHKIKES